jgi:tRNA(fMet)-specific endonuclease VapC
MAIILDADVIIRGEKGTFDLATWMAKHADEAFELSAITVAELWHGVERAGSLHRPGRERYIRALLEVLPVIAYTQLTALRHARIWAELESAGKVIDSYDLIVAATALERGSAVATFNQRHFSQVQGLKLIEPR